MKVTNEAGVLARSERFFSTPSATARNLFFYVTRVGHYYYDEQYNFLDSCDVAHQESHKNFFLTYIRSGCMYFQTTQLFTAERGQVALRALERFARTIKVALSLSMLARKGKHPLFRGGKGEPDFGKTPGNLLFLLVR